MFLPLTLGLASRAAVVPAVEGRLAAVARGRLGPVAVAAVEVEVDDALAVVGFLSVVEVEVEEEGAGRLARPVEAGPPEPGRVLATAALGLVAPATGWDAGEEGGGGRTGTDGGAKNKEEKQRKWRKRKK